MDTTRVLHTYVLHTYYHIAPMYHLFGCTSYCIILYIPHAADANPLPTRTHTTEGGGYHEYNAYTTTSHPTPHPQGVEGIKMTVGGVGVGGGTQNLEHIHLLSRKLTLYKNKY